VKFVMQEPATAREYNIEWWKWPAIYMGLRRGKERSHFISDRKEQTNCDNFVSSSWNSRSIDCVEGNIHGSQENMIILGQLNRQDKWSPKCVASMCPSMVCLFNGVCSTTVIMQQGMRCETIVNIM
jgi:hypothetical protein